MKNFQGVYSVVPTPFTASDDIDRESLKRTVDLFIKAGVDGLTVLGVTSEVAKLDERERGIILDTVMEKVDGRVPVVVGSSADGLKTCIAYSKAARAAGAAAVMISPPRMPKLNSEAVVRHYKSVAEAVDMPIVVQDYPPVSGYAMEASLLVRIAMEVPHAKAIKLEDPPTPFKTARIIEQAGKKHIDILGGLGGMFLFEELLAGASGAMTGFAYPEILVEVVKLFRSGKLTEARDRFYYHVPLMRFEFQEGIGMAIRKEMLRRRGAFPNALVRAPGLQLDPSTKTALDHLLNSYRKDGNEKWIWA
jgi:4-hydroxy-tetrahydrodipicolinate synthase